MLMDVRFWPIADVEAGVAGGPGLMSASDPKRTFQGEDVAEVIAKRLLKYSVKGDHRRHALEVRIYAPHVLTVGCVAFEFDAGAAGCRWEIVGLPEAFDDVAYGADSLQALQLAADVEPVIRSLQGKYDMFFPTGEPYFER